MDTNIVTREDMNYFVQQTTSDLNMILSGMVALLNDNDNKVQMLENQTWFQRMSRTISGKNKMTQQEIQRNHDRINAYMAQAMSGLYEQQCIDHQIMISLGNRLNEVYAEHIQLKQMLGAFVTKLNEKIESIDNFHMLNTEIEQGVYSNYAPIVAVCKILSQMDKRCIQDFRKMNILQRTMCNQNILNDMQTTLFDYLMGIADIPMDDVGTIYIELDTIRGNFMANIILGMIENYHFLPNMARKLKNKQALVNDVIAREQLEPTMELSINEVYSDFVNSKLDMIEGLLPISDIQFDAKLSDAEKLFLDCKLDEAFEIFHTLAEKGNGRAMYYVAEYYSDGLGDVVKNNEIRDEWRLKGKDTEDALAILNAAYVYPEDSDERNEIFNDTFNSVLKLAEDGDVIAQDELSIMYENGYGCVQCENEKNRWRKASAEGGYWKAMYSLAWDYVDVEKYEEALKWLNRATDRGYSLAMTFMGVMYDEGCGVEENIEIAKKWYLRAAELGEALAQDRLGYLYENGFGGEVNYEIAAKWYRKSAEGGDPEGMCDLANLYRRGKGVTKNVKEAIRWYEKAAKNGYSVAQYCLGECYYYGNGCLKDYDKAKEWLIKAAKQGDDEAKERLWEWFEEEV